MAAMEAIILNVLTVATVSAKIGYFWHITDLHWDTNYYNRNNNCGRLGTHAPLGRFGDHNCDSPWSLIESAARTMREKHGDNIEFVLWTGDGLSHSSYPAHHQIAALQNLTHLLSHVFSSQFVFPVLGHDDPRPNLGEHPYRHLAALWKHWLPTEALHTFNKGGYYTIEQKNQKLRIIALNTNLLMEGQEGEDPGGQWAWLEVVLLLSKRQRETVYLVGHMAPGADERQGNPAIPSMPVQHSAKYMKLVRKYSDIITGQFFGHLHSDTFRVVYNEKGKPISWILLAPSVTPRRTSSGINNPGLRLYRFDTDTGMILDYTQYFLDLSLANQKDSADWIIEYNFTTYYGVSQVTPFVLHNLSERFTTPEGYHLFMRYYQANSARSYDLQLKNAAAHAHYCAITRLDPAQYQNCIATAASPLAASKTTHTRLSTVCLVAMATIFTVIAR